MSRFFIHSKTLSYPMRLHKSTGSPEPLPITFVINTSRYGFIMLGSSDSKKKKTLGHIYDTERPERLNDRALNHPILGPKFGPIPNAKKYVFFPIPDEKFPI